MILLSIEYKGKTISKIFCSLDYKNKESYISYIYVFKEYRRKGLGLYMLWSLYDYLIKEGIKKVSFDDCSDFYRKRDNIYRKIGASYVNNKGPEMIWNLELRYIKKLRKDYNNNNNYNNDNKYTVLIGSMLNQRYLRVRK